MKKIILTVAAIFAFGVVNAQEEIKSKKGENYLPEAGDWAISFNADGIFEFVGNSFNGNGGNNAPEVNYIQSNAFVGKKFTTDKNALRVVANLGFGSGSTTTPGVLNTVETKSSSFNLAAGLGKEWRKGKTRLQGFYGADALLTVSSGSTETTTNDTAAGTFVQSVKNKNGLGLGVGVQGFIGAEYFIFPKFSIGAQYTYGLNVGIQGKGENTTQIGTAAAVTTDTGKSTNFNLGSVDLGTNSIGSLNLTLHF